MSEERMETARQWIGDYPVNPHPDLGRDGVVCPFMVRSVRRDYITMRSFDANLGDDALASLGRSLRADMVRRGEALGSDRIYLVSMVVPYGLSEPELKAMVERVHGTLRPEFVGSGFMAGDFWPDHELVGLHSDDFRPFASPIPLLGVRPMVPADVLFFAKHESTPEGMLRYLGYFRQVFEGRLNDHWASQLEQAERSAKQALAEQKARSRTERSG